jgi:hypothetical protein
VLDFVSEAALVEVEQVMQCDFGFDLANGDRSSEFTRRAVLDGGVVGGDASQHLFVSVVGCRFEDAEEVSDEAVAPLPALTRGPDHPELVCAASDRLFEIGGGVQNRIDVRVAIDPYRRKPERQRSGGDQKIFRELGGFNRTQNVFREVVDVECSEARAGANLFEVEAPLAKNFLRKGFSSKNDSARNTLSNCNQLTSTAAIGLKRRQLSAI